MAKATVTLQLDPRDLHLICLALHLTRSICALCDPDDPPSCTLFYRYLSTTLNNGDPVYLANHAEHLLAQVSID